MTVPAPQVLAALRRLPVRDLDEIVPGTALILAPHPDDESLGCGGLIAQACQRDQPPVVAIVTDGTGSHPGSRSHPPDRLREVREAETRAAVRHLGLEPDRLRFLRLRDTAVPMSGPALDAAAMTVSRLVRETGCDTILATWRHDPHGDHLAVSRIAERAASSAGVRLLSYPVWGWTLGEDVALPDLVRPGARLEIAAQLECKRLAIAAHASQHGGLITDDPNGFRLPRGLLAVFEQPYEVYLEEP